MIQFTISADSHDILSFSARVLNTTASVGALNSFASPSFSRASGQMP
jgi:hypothetical protein